ncbi:MAG TPA: hypothetical protein VFC09_08455 [Candidatus Dormibacteraeota bacterium]|nr:hypothetical protein [Candidatus Dormibacteraeota bacterium]
MRDWLKRRYVLMAVTAAVLAGVVPATGARAAASTGGSWEGALTLPTYPCPVASCGGSFNGTLSGTAAGLDGNGHPFVVIWPDPTASVGNLPNLSATFDYTEACPLGTTGTADGSFTLSGGYVDDDGVISHDGTMTGQFGWLRAGLAVAVSTSGGVITGSGQTLATQQSIGEGGGAFVPTSVPSTCFNVQSLTAQVAGAFDNPE